jgi:hypothetical protein
MGERKGKPRKVEIQPLEFPKHRPIKEPNKPEKKPEKVPA